MKSQVEIISQTIVKPSSPTPIQLRHLHLSFLDQIMPTVFSPWLVTYLNSPTISNAERCERLRKSLSDTLTLFYPFAGRVRGNSHVDCNDEGVPFVEAKAKGTIQKILQNPCCNNFNDLIPLKINENSDLGAFVQITYFECGGMVVGLGLSHKIADASSAFRFLNAWGAIERGHSNSVVFPNFEAAKYFRPVDGLSGFDPWHDVVKNSRKIVSKRFMFDATSIKKLRDKYVKSCCNSGNKIESPTRIQLLTAFMCSRFMATTQFKADNSYTIYKVKHAVDLRARMDPPLSEQYIGNHVCFPVVAEPHIDGEENYRCGVINQMRRRVKSVDAEYVKKLGNEAEEHLKVMKKEAGMQRQKKVVTLTFTSWCRFPVYEIDFGWGKPEWLGTPCWPFQNFFIFCDTKEKGGIEIFVHLEKEDMAKFENDDELAAFASPFCEI